VSADIISFTILRSVDSSFQTGVSTFAQANQLQSSSFVLNDNDPSLIVGAQYFYSIFSRNLACSSSAYCGASAVVNITVVGELRCGMPPPS
jgi:hypothetical protein